MLSALSGSESGSPVARGTPTAAARAVGGGSDGHEPAHDSPAVRIEVESDGRDAHAKRIQWAWWNFRANVLDPRKDSERATAKQRTEARTPAVQPKSREAWIMDKKVGKRRRKLPLLGFQQKQMQLDAEQRVLSYWKYSEKHQARVKSIELDAVTQLEQRNSEKEWLLVISLATGSKATTYTFKMFDKEASDTWLKYLSAACPPNTQISTSIDGGIKHARFSLVATVLRR
ncbi:hypothetical protein T492DRAFT_940488 [Pavlovales sp. CCMP2436]|nr:hypothetical protein T492DRAFT_940488 [Pavlovales sp. CCMP2436]